MSGHRLFNDISKTVTVLPVKGRFITGIPAVEQEVSPAEAKRLVSTLAFTIKRTAQDTGPHTKG